VKLLIDFIITNGIGATALIIFLIIKSKKRNELPQKILVIFFGMLLLYLVYYYATLHDILLLRYLTFNFNGVTPLFLGPIIFLYIKSLFEDNSRLAIKNIVHFIPSFIFILFISTPMLISLNKGGMVFDYLEFIADHRLLMFMVFDIVFLTYSLLTIMLFLRYRKTLKLNFSNLSEEDLDWVKYMLAGVVIISSGHLILAAYDLFFEITVFERRYLTLISIFILISWLGYHGIYQSKILLPHFLIDNLTIKKDKRENDLSNPGNEELQAFKTRLEKVLYNDKPYLDESLTLSRLAELIPTTDKKLSAFLNQHLETTFYDIINSYRVESVKEKLHSDEFAHMTLLGIAYESGFNSKTSFNRIFKKQTGLSPSEYKSRLK
jgi:AraC-like DNA-binding protein